MTPKQIAETAAIPVTEIEKLRAENQRLRGAILLAIPVVDRDHDLSDEEVLRCHGYIVERRRALRHFQAVLAIPPS